MFKKIAATVLSSLLLLTNGAMAFALEFSDVPNDYWAYEAITKLAEDGVITGYPDKSFKPDASVTREEFSGMLVKALNKETMEASGCVPYTDLSKNMWSYSDINRINDLGLVVGYPDNTFKPANNITKTEAMIVLANTIKENCSCNAKELDIFKDNAEIRDWAKGGLSKAVANDIYVKYPDPTVLSPNAQATRAEIADLLYKVRKQGILMAKYQKEGASNISTLEHLKLYGDKGSNEVQVKRLYAQLQTGNIVETALVSAFTTKKAAAGEEIKLTLTKDLYTEEGTFLLPAGTIFQGVITEIINPKLFNRNAKVGFNLTKLVLPSGKTYDISAGAATESGLIETGYTMRNFKRDFITTAAVIGVGAGMGALIGLTDHSDEGAIIGTCSGAGAGVLTAAVIPGYHLQFKEGDLIRIKFNEPVEIDR